MSGGAQRVLGKRAFDSAAAGHAPFEPLSTEFPGRTLSRARDRIVLLERDLAVARAQLHRGNGGVEVVVRSDLDRVGDLLGAGRVALAKAEPDPAGERAKVRRVVVLVAEAQRLLEADRQRRLHAPE